jgi:GNAT superfamily N-acetyltransferase
MAWTAPDDTGAQVTVVPANEASWQDLEAVFGTRGEPARCRCQWFKARPVEWRGISADDRAERLRDQTGCGDPDAPETSGLVAYLDGEPVGWCAVEPRTTYQHLLTMRVPWVGRDEDRTDDDIWAVTCFVVRVGFRRRGISRVLAAAAADFARDRGARSVEGYSMIVDPGREVVWGELYVGNRTVFEDAGFHEVSRTKRRAVMRIDFGGS